MELTTRNRNRKVSLLRWVPEVFLRHADVSGRGRPKTGYRAKGDQREMRARKKPPDTQGILLQQQILRKIIKQIRFSPF